MLTSKISNRVEILKQNFIQSTGLPFRDLLPQSTIQEIIDELQIKYYRRIFDPFVTIWAFLSQVLDAEKSCHNAVSRVIAWLSTEDVELPSTDTSAYCQARLRLSSELLKRLSFLSGVNLEKECTLEQLWCGRHVKVIDTSTASMPDTPENQLCYPQPSSQKPGCGFPITKIAVIFSLTTGALISSIINVLNIGDVKARLLYKFLNPEDVLVGDRAFCSYADLYWIQDIGCDAVIRKNNNHRKSLETGYIVNKQDKIVTWCKPKNCPKALTKEQFASLPKTIIVREISYDVNVPGFRTEHVIIVTTLLDAKQFPTHEIIELYHQRWNVEVNLKHLKTSLGMDILRSKTPEMVRKEIYAHFLAYNLLRSLMWEAGSVYGVSPFRISLQGTRNHFNNFISKLVSVSNNRVQKIYRSLLKIVVHKLVPLRPERVEPRVVKRRPKSYPSMQQPRKSIRKKLLAG